MTKYPRYPQAIKGGGKFDCKFDIPVLGFKKGRPLEVVRSRKLNENYLSVVYLTEKDSFILGFCYENFGEISAIGGFGERYCFKKSQIKFVGIIPSISFDDYVLKITEVGYAK